MNLHTLKPPKGSKKSRKRVGRGVGTGKGKTCGRGHKGFKSRTGSKIKAGYEGGQMPLQRRLPKRGFRPFRRVEYQEVNLRDLENCEQAIEFTPEVMKELGLIKRQNQPVKVLGFGKLERKIHVKAQAFSRVAMEKIKNAGGETEVI